MLIIISVIEILIPKGNMKRYINFIVGLFIILIITNPLTRFLNLDFKTENFFNEDLGSNFNYHKSVEAMNYQQNAQIMNIYTEKIKHEMKNIINSNLNYRLKDIEVFLVEENHNQWTIDSIIIELHSEELIENKKINIEKIERIDLDNKSLDTDGLDKDNNYDDLKDLIHTSFGIEEDKIYVKLSK